MLVIAYYSSDNKFQAIAGRNWIGTPWRTRTWEKPILFSSEKDAERWEKAHCHLTKEGKFLIMEEERAKHLLRFGC